MSGHAVHRRRPVRALLNGKRRRIEKQSKAIAHQLEKSLVSPGSGNPAKQVTELRTTLQDLRHEVQHNGAGQHTHLVAGALHDLDKGLASLSKSIESTDPNTKLKLLAESKHALDKAGRKAKAAGHDWPL